MKHRGCTAYMNDERDDNIIEVFDEIMSKRGYTMVMSDIHELVANSPAKRFWITAVRAYRAILLIRKGKRIHEHPYPLREEMYNEINKRVSVVLDKNPGMSLKKAVSIVVEQPAPKFYMSPGRIKISIIRKSKRAYGIY